jgi:polysaccharide biosynthesis/export protein
MVTQVSLRKWFIPILAGTLYLLVLAAGCQQSPSRVYKVGYSSGASGQRIAGGAAGESPNNYSGEAYQQNNASAGPETAVTEQNSDTSSTYHIGPGDSLRIKIYQLLELQKEEVLVVDVDPRGQVYLPLLTHVQAAGLTCEQLRSELLTRLGKDFIRDPRVDVSVEHYGSKVVMVLGAVRKPGPVALESDSASLIDVISRAEGITADAAPNIEILRGAYNPANGVNVAAMNAANWTPPGGANAYARELVSVKKLFAEEGAQVNPVIHPGDVVKVLPGTEGFVYLAGEVHQPGAKPFRRPLTILQAISTAGGTTRVAEEKECKIIRRTAEGEEKVIVVDLDKIRAGKEKNLVLACDDTILVRANAMKQFWAGVDDLIKRGVNTGMDVKYDAGRDMGIPQSYDVVSTQ